MQEITFRSGSFYDDIADHSDRHIHLILIATKPDIIKQIPIYRELKKRGHLVVLGHTGQHYDERLSGGMLKEFGVEPDFNLNVRGAMHEIVSQIIGRLGHVIAELKARGKVVIPYVHGDTTAAMASSNAGFCHIFASVHVEAGIRTLTPDYANWQLAIGRLANVPTANLLFDSSLDIEEWRKFLMDRNHWKRGSLEPYPEQFNTRCSECASGIHLAPVELDREFMLSEGFPDDRIFVVGNSVADALRQAQGKRLEHASVFDRHPQLAGGDFVRFCIHRRENCLSERRFRAIIDCLRMFVEDGRTVLLISMNQTEAAFDRFGMRGDIEKLAKNYKNFVLSPVWPEYGDVIAAMSRAAVCATDSGSMQEEMNVMGIPCVTLRFGSDRAESAIAGGNLIAPPIDAHLMKHMIEFAWNNPDMRKAPKLYGTNASAGLSTSVSAQCIDAVEKVLSKGEVFRTEEERLNL